MKELETKYSQNEVTIETINDCSIPTPNSCPVEPNEIALRSTIRTTEVFSTQEKNEDERSWYARFVKPSIGLIFAALSAFFYSLTSLVVKKLHHIDPIEFCTFRLLGIVIPAIAICVHYNKNPVGPRGTRINVFIRGIMGTLTIVTQYYGIRNLPLADATVIICSAPVFTTIIARIFLKEQWTLFSWFVIALTLFGVILITKPPFIFGTSLALEHGYTADNLFGAIMAFVSNIFIGITYMLVRQVKHVHYAIIMVGDCAIGIIMSQAYTQIAGTFCIPPCGLDRYLIVIMAALSYIGHLFKTLALQYEQAALVSICRTTAIVFAFIWQVVFFDDVLSYLSVIGAIVVTVSVVGLGLQKWLISIPETSPIRNKLRFILL